MRGNDAQRPLGQFQIHDQRAARLRTRQCDAPAMRRHTAAHQQRIAAPAMPARRLRDRDMHQPGPTLDGGEVEQAHAIAEASIRLLQGHDVRIEFLDHGGDAAGVEAAVHPDAPVDVVGRHDQAPRRRVARRRRRRVAAAQRAFQHMQRAAHTFGQAGGAEWQGLAWAHWADPQAAVMKGARRVTVASQGYLATRGGENTAARDRTASATLPEMAAFHGHAFREEYAPMLHYSLVFLLVALVAGVLGFGGIASAASGAAKVLFVIFLVLFATSLIVGRGWE